MRCSLPLSELASFAIVREIQVQSASVGGAAVDRASISRSLPATSVAHAEFTRETREGDQRTAVGGEMPRPRSQSVKRVAFDARRTVASVLGRLGAEVAPGVVLIADSAERDGEPVRPQAPIRGLHSPQADPEPLGAL